MQRRAWLCTLPAALLAGCGFQLRGEPALPFTRIALLGFAERSALRADLKTALQRQVQVVDDLAQAQLVLRARQDLRERSVVASTAAGQVREVQLRVRLEFGIETPGGRELVPATELLLVRDMSYSESFALAKEQEEAQLYRNMQADIVAQLMRRLARVKVA
jgi:LPS-assembly lipoprotein